MAMSCYDVPKVDGHPSSGIRDRLFSIFDATILTPIWRSRIYPLKKEPLDLCPKLRLRIGDEPVSNLSPKNDYPDWRFS
jgi:hypothetical protein